MPGSRRRAPARPPAPRAGEADPLRLHAANLEQVLTGFIADETRKAGMETVVVGLSGGIDSAVAAALARRALGRDGVVALLMPHRDSAPSSLAHAVALARRLGIRTERHEITPQVEAYFESAPADGAPPGRGAAAQAAWRRRRGNKMARERMSILYDRSAAHGALVLGTSNKTELLLGYGTLHGDMACAINPLGDLYKTQVRQLAAHLRIPEAIRRKPPSADLWPGQTDESELGLTYETADRLLHLLVDERASREEAIASGWDPKTVARVLEAIRRSQFKRRMPLVAKVSARTVGLDFRYPRDWEA